MKEFFHTTKVSDKHIDENKHLNNVVYVQWMQDVAVLHSSSVGDTLEYQEKNSYMWVARHHEIDYLRSAYLGDEVNIKTWVVPYKKTSSLREYEFYNSKDELLAKAKTIWVCLNPTSLRPVKIPEEILNLYLKT